MTHFYYLNPRISNGPMGWHRPFPLATPPYTLYGGHRPMRCRAHSLASCPVLVLRPRPLSLILDEATLIISHFVLWVIFVFHFYGFKNNAFFKLKSHLGNYVWMFKNRLLIFWFLIFKMTILYPILSPPTSEIWFSFLNWFYRFFKFDFTDFLNISSKTLLDI